MKQNLSFILSALLIILNSSCYVDKYNELYPANIIDTCDPTLPVTYTAVVKNIMLQNCVSCHSSKVKNGDVVLETYQDVKSHAIDGSLPGAIEGANGYQRMPPGAPLRDCDIEQIKTWIKNGTPE